MVLFEDLNDERDIHTKQVQTLFEGALALRKMGVKTYVK